MKSSSPRSSLLIAAGLTVCSLTISSAETVTSEIQGFIKLTAPANSDTSIAPAFGRPSVWAGAVDSSLSARLTVSGSPAWAVNQFMPSDSQTDTFYVRVLSGAQRGHYFTIASNDDASVLVDGAGADLSTIQAGDRVEIAPYWTLGTLYPVSQANVSFVPSDSPLLRQTELAFYDPSGVGINRSPTKTFYYYNSAWRQVGAPETTSFSNQVVLPDTFFLHRNKSGATSVVENGRVFNAALATFLEGQGSIRQDNEAALAFPVAVTLRQAGFVESGAFTPSTSDTEHQDELLIYNEPSVGRNRVPSATLFYYNGGWRKVGAALDVDFSDSVSLTPGHGFVVRKPAGASTTSWTFETSL